MKKVVNEEIVSDSISVNETPEQEIQDISNTNDIGVIETPDPEKPVHVIIPYLKTSAQGRELEFAVKGWKKHFKEDFKIVIVGDSEPFMDGDDQIVYLPHTPSQKNPPLDIVEKMLLVIASLPQVDGFVWSNDDIYAVNDFDLTDVKVLKSIGLLAGDLKSTNPFQVNMAKTAQLLKKEGRPIRNFSTHLPVWYDVEKLLELIELYEMDKESYLIHSLYFNYFYPSRVPLKLSINFDNYKCGIYRPNPNMDIVRRAFEDKVWINNSPEGYIPELIKLLDKHYK